MVLGIIPNTKFVYSLSGTAYAVPLVLTFYSSNCEAFLNTWNELLFANTFVDDAKYKTLPVGIMSFVGEHSTNWGIIGAGMVIATLPTVDRKSVV